MTILRSSVLLLIAALLDAEAFAPTPYQTSSSSSSSTVLYGGARGLATSKEGKRATVTAVKDLLENSEMVFSAPAGSLTVTQSQDLRKAMPEGTTVKVVKNTLMYRAVQDTEFSKMADEADADPAKTSNENLLKGANMWFFVEEDIGGTISAYKQFMKDNGKKDTHTIYGGVLEANVYDAAGVEAISKLPSKQDLYARIAGSIKAVPTKVARVVNATPSKLARAIKLATMPEDDNEDDE